MRVIVKGNWGPFVGTDYCDALGIYPNLKAAEDDASTYAWERWEGCDDDDGLDDEGPDWTVEEYVPGDDGHDNERAGGGSFEEEFSAMEK